MSETGERRRRRDERSAGEQTGAQPTATPEWLTTAVPTSPTGTRPATPGSRRAMRLAATSPSGSPEVRDGGASGWAPPARPAAPGTPGNGTPTWAAAAQARPDVQPQPARRSVLDGRDQPSARGVTTAAGPQLPVPAEPPVLPSRLATPSSGSATHGTARRSAWGPVPATGPDGVPGAPAPARGASTPLPTRAPAPPRSASPSGQSGINGAPAGTPRPGATAFGVGDGTERPGPPLGASDRASRPVATPVGAPAPGAAAPTAGKPAPPAAPMWTAGARTQQGGPATAPRPAPPVAPSSSPTAPSRVVPPAPGAWYGAGSAAVAPPDAPAVTAAASAAASAPSRAVEAPRVGSWAVPPAQASSDDEASEDAGPFVLSSGQSPFPSTGVTQVAAPTADDDEPTTRRHPYTWLHVIVLAIVAFVLGFLIFVLWDQGRSGAEGESGNAAVVDTSPAASSSAV